jgi:mannose-1-phosphate guanylyltransferase/phosphomannomutase
MKAVVLAAGEGTRLRPLTLDSPKPMIAVGPEPAIHYLLKQLSGEGFDDIIIIVGRMGNQVINYVGDGSRYGVRVKYAVKPEKFLSGTAGSLKLIEYMLDDTFLIAQSDTLSEIPLDEAMVFHRKTAAHATLVLTRVEDPSAFGVAVVDESGSITEFQEKPSPGTAKSNLVSTGFYIMEPEALDYIESETFDFAMDLFPRLLKLRKRISGFASTAFWVDIGTLEGYLRGTQWTLDKLAKALPTNLEFADPSNHVMASHEAQIGSRAIIRGPALIEAGAIIEDGTEIQHYSVIKKDARISAGSVISRSVIFERATIERDCRVSGSVIAQSATLRANASIEGSIIGAGSVIGQKANLLEGSRVWPSVHISDFQTVNGIVFVPLERSFQFYTSLGQDTGIMSSTAEGFIDALEKVPIESIEFHAKRRDIEKWVRGVLESNELADEIEGLRRKAIMGEELRTELIRVTKKWSEEVSTSTIAVTQS